jgi:hypothetical protein
MNMELGHRKITITSAFVLIGTMLIFASGLVNIDPPEQELGGPGFVYTVEYECGVLESADINPQAQPGEYATNILVHNPFTASADVYIKILPATGLPESSLWLDTEAITIEPDGALEISCDHITGRNPTVPPFSKGLLIISHPLELDQKIVLKQPVFSDESLDVVASYTYFTKVIERTEASDTQIFNKIICKVKDRGADGRVTSQLFDVIIPVVPGEPLFELKQRILEELRSNGIDVDSGTRIVEVVSIEAAGGNASGNIGVGVGSSKDVEKIEGKMIPYVPLPPAPDEGNGDNGGDEVIDP